MPALTKPELVAKLTELGVEANEDMTAAELRELLKQHSGDAQGDEDGDKSEPKPSLSASETAVMLVNVMHDGVMYEKGSEVVLNSDLLAVFKEKGFVA